MAAFRLVASLVVAAQLAFASPSISQRTYPQYGVTYDNNSGRPQCTVTAGPNKTNDVPNILKAFNDCNNGGTVIFPEGQNYWIGERLNPILSDVIVEWRGIWTLSDNLTYWRANGYPVAFQNHHAGFVITGDNIRINGYGTGGIYGNGNAWYNAEKAFTLPGRPFPMVWWNVSDVALEHFFIKDSPLWALNIMNGTNMDFDDIYVNSTALAAPYGTNWVQNTDGFDTMDSTNIRLRNFVYQGGDDCIAVKPQSHNIDVYNVTCHGGNGIAIGSLGQYLSDASVSNVVVDTVKIVRYNNAIHNAAYIKTWVGVLTAQKNTSNGYYENGGLPRGGGWGTVSNLRFSNFDVGGASSGISINQDSGNNGTLGTSLMQVENVVFENFTGSITGAQGAVLQCGVKWPCFNIAFKNIDLQGGANLTGKCTNVIAGSIRGLSC